MGKSVNVKMWDEITDEELGKMEKQWLELIEGVNFNNHEESYNFHLNFPECLICGEEVAHWIPSNTDGWLMPACDKHYSNTRITEKRWAKARAEREKTAQETADLRCYKCDGMPVSTWIPAKQAKDWITLEGNAPDWIPLCDNCDLAYLESTL